MVVVGMVYMKVGLLLRRKGKGMGRSKGAEGGGGVSKKVVSMHVLGC